MKQLNEVAERDLSSHTNVRKMKVASTTIVGRRSVVSLVILIARDREEMLK